MSELAKCGKDCAPVLQVRGQMGPGDYTHAFLPDGRLDLDFHKKVEMHEAIENDCRVLCKTCGVATGWFHPFGKEELPQASEPQLVALREAAKVETTKAWGDLTAHRSTKDQMVAALTKQFGEEAMLKHFGLAI
jgi:hypothetical protein